MTSFYFIASPLHVITSYLQLSEGCDNDAIAIVVNENKKLNKLVGLFQKHFVSGFKEVVFLNKLSGFFKEKLKKELSVYHQIDCLLNKYNPSHIYTGNDRRLEFQYAAFMAKKQFSCKVIYLDDGLYSYISRAKNHKKYIRRSQGGLLKWLISNAWKENVNQVGSSSFIDEKRLFLPDFSNNHTVPVKRLDMRNVNEISFRSSFQKILEAYGFSANELTSIDVVYIAPHDYLLKNNSLYLRALIKILEDCKGVFAVKNHPRSNEALSDLLPIKRDFIEIPQDIPFEILLPFLKSCKIFGDTSTALLLSKLIVPEAAVISLSIGENLATDYDNTKDIVSFAGVQFLQND